MNPWTIIEAIAEIAISLSNWRTYLCGMIGIALAAVAYQNIAADPLRWIVAGAIVVASLIVGSKWEGSR